MSSIIPVPLRRPMAPRDPHEHGRVATPLELLFDLVFVVAIASNAAQLHHAISQDHLGSGVAGYAMGWFAIWWAWVGYTWFASAYDNDDVGFRLLSFVIMTGALMMAAGIPDLIADGQSVLAVSGYAVMRLGLVGLWLRAAKDHPEGRRTALMYAVGITVVQLFWIARLWVPQSWIVVTFLVGVAGELAVPWIAERRSGATPFHPHHVAERYGLLTIIVLGEVILSSVLAIQQAMATPAGGGGGHTAPFAATGSGVGWGMVPLIAGGLLTVYALWWLYFKREHADLVDNPRTVFFFGYGHLVVFASIAAVGAGLAAAVDVSTGASETSGRVVALVIGGAVALVALSLAALHAIADGAAFGPARPALAVAAGVLLVAALVPSLPWAVLGIGLVLVAGLAQHVARSGAEVPAEVGTR